MMDMILVILNTLRSFSFFEIVYYDEYDSSDSKYIAIFFHFLKLLMLRATHMMYAKLYLLWFGEGAPY